MKYYITKETFGYDLQATSSGVPTNAVMEYPEYRDIKDFEILDVIEEVEQQTELVQAVDENGELLFEEVEGEEIPVMIEVVKERFVYRIEENQDKVLLREARLDEEKLEQVRSKRDDLLAKTDKFMLADYPISEEDLDKIKLYRQELRDLPSVVDLDNPAYPVYPI